MCVRLSIVPFLYSKRTAAARSLVSRYIEKRTFCRNYEHTSRGTTLHECRVVSPHAWGSADHVGRFVIFLSPSEHIYVSRRSALCRV